MAVETKRNLTLALEGEDRTTIEQIIEDKIGIFLNGEYTPTITNGDNINASAITGVATYNRTGNIVQVFGYITIDPTQADSTPTLTSLSLSLPIGNLDTNQKLAGNFGMDFYELNAPTGRIKADATNELALFQYTSIQPSNRSFNFNFQYEIQ